MSCSHVNACIPWYNSEIISKQVVGIHRFIMGYYGISPDYIVMHYKSGLKPGRVIQVNRVTFCPG